MQQEEDDDGDTDSIASSSSSISHLRMKSPVGGGVSPLNRRRSIRLAHKQVSFGPLGCERFVIRVWFEKNIKLG